MQVFQYSHRSCLLLVHNLPVAVNHVADTIRSLQINTAQLNPLEVYEFLSSLRR